MRRFTLTSVTILTGIALAPACGAVLGIDTDRVLEDGGAPGATASAKNDSGPASGTSSGTSGGVDSGPTTPPPKCDPDACGKLTNGFFGDCDDGLCKRSCADGAFRCGGVSGTITCPDDQDCFIDCQGDGCNKLTCRGGHSCTFDCTKGDCHDATCSSPACTFRCKDNACDNASCTKGSDCSQLCLNGAGMKQDCKKPIKSDD